LWIDFMQTAIKQHPDEEFPAPPPEDPALRAARAKPDKPDSAPGDAEGH
jgi:hypothetical protein